MNRKTPATSMTAELRPLVGAIARTITVRVDGERSMYLKPIGMWT